MRKTGGLLLAVMFFAVFYLIWLLVVPHAHDTMGQVSKSGLPSIDAPTQILLQKVKDAYNAADSLVLAGQVTIELGAGHIEKYPFNSYFQRGTVKRFRHEQVDLGITGSDGTNVYICQADRKGYFLVPAVGIDGGVLSLPEPIPHTLETCDPSLKFALVPDVAEEISKGASKVELRHNTMLNNVAYKTIFITPEIGLQTTILLLNPRTNLLRQAKHEFLPNPDGTADQVCSVTVDYDSSQTNIRIEPGRFSWKPPPGAGNLMPPQAIVGRPAPDFQLHDLDGDDIQLAALRGNVVVLDFWATWCGPCQSSLPLLEQVVQDINSPKLRILTVNRQEDSDTVSEFVKRTHLSLPVLLDPKSLSAEAYLVHTIPQSVVIGKDGLVKYIAVGFAPENERLLRQAIRLALEAP